MVRVFCKERSMQKMWLWTKLWCHSDVSASVSSSHMIKEVIVCNNGEREESGTRVKSRVWIRYNVKSKGDIGLQLEFGSGSDVRESA